MALRLNRYLKESILFKSRYGVNKLTFFEIVDSTECKFLFDGQSLSLMSGRWLKLTSGIEIKWTWKSKDRVVIHIEANEDILILREELDK